MEFTLILAQALAILAFVALLLAVLVFVRRAARFLAETRDIERFRRAVADITGRAIGSLDSVTGQIDGLRRRTVAAEAIVDALGTSREALTHYADESRALAQEIDGHLAGGQP